MTRLFIAEKPELARAIVKGLGGGENKKNYYKCGNDYVTWCIGHILELYDPEDYDPKFKKWNIDDLPIKYDSIQYKAKENTKSQLSTIKLLLSQVDSVVHAGDPDAEGQLIVDEVLTYFNNQKPVKRFSTNDNTHEVILKSLANMTDNKDYYNLYQSALARSVGDQLYGYNMTRAYTVSANKKGYDGVLSVGRVQTAILGLVVRRTRANKNHEKQDYFDIVGRFNFSDVVFSAKYQVKETDPVDSENRVIDKAFANKILSECDNQAAVIVDFKSEKKSESAPLPYNMLKLQADCSKLYDYSPNQVMSITQELREKYQLITYNGSDCQYLNEEQHADAPEVLQAIFSSTDTFNSHIDNADSSIKSRAFNSKNVSAHHAIIPTKTKYDITKLDEKLSNVYKLIARAYLAQFLPKREYQKTVVLIDVKENQFKATSSITTKIGYKALYQDDLDNEKITENEIDLSSLEQADKGTCFELSVIDRETKPPKLYTMRELLLDLTRVAKYIKDPVIKQLMIDKDKDLKGEHGGIGTSRTRGIHIDNLFKRGYFQKKNKNIIASELGEQFFDLLPTVATDPDMTALWHEQQNDIEQGKITYQEFISKLNEHIELGIEKLKQTGLDIKVEQHSCPQCETGVMKQRKGKNGIFWACSNYPDCKSTLPNKAGKPDYKSLETHPCPSCDSDMKRRKGQYGFFWSCTNYPECKTTVKDKRGKPDLTTKKQPDLSEFKCGECDKPLIKRVKIKGRGKERKEIPWYGCSGFPNCKATYFDKNGKPKYD